MKTGFSQLKRPHFSYGAFSFITDFIANEKKISGSNEDKLKRMHKNILISYAYIDDVILARHLYIFDASRIRLLHSCLSSEKQLQLNLIY